VETHPRLGRRRRPIPLLFVLCGVLVAVFAGVFLTRRPAPKPPDAAGLQMRLSEMRGAIKTYRTRHVHGPATLQELVAEKLLRDVPVDPITGSRTTWKLATEESVAVQEDFRAGGGEGRQVWIIDVHSGARGNDPNGRSWADY
jgi:general secretion pathway protein G